MSVSQTANLLLEGRVGATALQADGENYTYDATSGNKISSRSTFLLVIHLRNIYVKCLSWLQSASSSGLQVKSPTKANLASHRLSYMSI